ncbi:YitT family protein [Rhodoferax aquaticus]|uniref:YitT family protein n=1 Tax=Rhodoferax aquaticus TaxID=2527691 RepID=A0A515ER52_9BURK|nr:YitT family protein [Rhodoferax aquaticus]QDL55125.1 YitT family protein [Rhodoferax aquaticus]
MQAPSPSLKHKPYEDIQALVTGSLFVAFGVLMFGHTGLLTGGTAGLAFLAHYASGWNFGALFFIINLPFYGLAYKRMGKAFTLKTFSAVGLLSVWTNVLPSVVQFEQLNPWFSAVMGGLLMGAGMLILFRHRASLGGLNVLVLYCQERFGWRAGKIQMAIDCSIVLCSLALVDWHSVLLSVLGAVMVNQTLAINHRAGRYITL